MKIPYKTAFIVNPAGGGGYSGRVWPLIAKRLDYNGQKYQAYFTVRQGDGTRLAEVAVNNGAELVVAVGGDGTIREVINGIEIRRTLFGIIPLGTGNGFRRSCAIPGQWDEALDGLARWEPRLIDVGKINGSCFLNVVGIGFDAAVAAMAYSKYSSLKGYMAYVAAFFDKLMNFDHFSASINTGTKIIEENRTLLLVIANGCFYGGAFAIAPQAVIDDGRLDLILVRKTNYSKTTLLAIEVLAKKHLASKAVVSLSGTNFRIETDHDVPVHVDGEVIGSLPADIYIEPASLKIIAPKNSTC
jgi:diacylglycerol kinase (ATP)